MPGPLDIYEENYPAYRSSVIPDLGSFFSNPLVISAGVGYDLFMSKSFLSRGKMLRTMDRLQRRSFLHDMRRATGGVSPQHARRYILTASERGMRNRIGIGFADRYGSVAARRMTLGRGLAGFSKFAAIYGVIEIASALGGALGDAISAWEPKRYENKRRSLELGTNVVDTRYAQTQRMRAIQAIHNTQLSTRAALGNEAAFMHLER